MVYKRGDIVTINFNPKKGEEVGKIRPALILSFDEENEILDTVIVMPLSTQLINDMAPFRVRIKKRDSLKYDSDVLINHVRTISKKRIGQKIASLYPNELDTIVDNLCKNFVHP